jgi:hypothetical protein
MADIWTVDMKIKALNHRYRRIVANEIAHGRTKEEAYQAALRRMSVR